MNPIIYHHENGNISAKIYVNEKNQLHNEHGPAVLVFYSNNVLKREEWHTNGTINREQSIATGGPAITEYNEQGMPLYEKWIINGKFHRDQNYDVDMQNQIGPAYIEWYENGQIRREEWCLEGEIHRHAGNALFEWDVSGKLIT